MDTLFIIIIGIAAVYLLWHLLRVYLILRGIVKQSLEVEQRFRERLEQIIHIVKQEQEGDMYYWYDNDNDNFLAQGRTWEDMIAALKERFPDHIFVLNHEEMIVGPDFEVVKFGDSLNGSGTNTQTTS